jgi:LacI family transcriptional regulator
VFDPPLTTIAIDPVALGAEAFDVLLGLIEGREAKSRVLPVELVVRGSTASAPA